MLFNFGHCDICGLDFRLAQAYKDSRNADSDSLSSTQLLVLEPMFVVKPRVAFRL